MPLINLIQLSPQPQYFFRMDRNIRRLTTESARDLMHHDPTMRQDEPRPFFARAEQ